MLEAWISPSIQPSWPINSEEVIKDQQSFTPWKTLQKSCRNSSRTKIHLNGVVISVIHTREDECRVRIHFEKCCIHLRDPLSVLVWFKEFMYYFFPVFLFLSFSVSFFISQHSLNCHFVTHDIWINRAYSFSFTYGLIFLKDSNMRIP